MLMTFPPTADSSKAFANAVHLHGPLADALLLGGTSVVAFLLIRLWNPDEAGFALLAAVMMALANVVNHPHFAHSYQLFYGSWQQARGAAGLPVALRWRWWLSGVAVPLVLALLLGFAAWRWSHGDGFWMAASLSVMGALVGWHYVKQGYGMAMVDAALKRRYWSPVGRRALLWNAYACWGTAWLFANTSAVGSLFWGFFGISFEVPMELVAMAALLTLGTTVWCTVSVTRNLKSHLQAESSLRWQQLPLSGLLAYGVTLYLWTLFAWADPAYALVIPFFHSLQYMTVVWRYKRNEAADDGSKPGDPFHGLLRFTGIGLAIGALGFWLLPGIVDYAMSGAIPFKTEGPMIAIACAWIFINVHHYFIDNVLWRQGNPNVARFLFGHGAAAQRPTT